jgi:hypothetical protein
VIVGDEWAPFEPAPPLAVQLERIGRRLDAALHRLAPDAAVAAHPWLAVGIAVVAGAGLALVPSRSQERRVDRTLGHTALALVGAVAARLVREYALAGVAGVARQWWGDRAREPDES